MNTKSLDNFKTPLGPGMYVCDNGRIACDDHAGMRAQQTGCDISGQPVLRVEEHVAHDNDYRCETCGKDWLEASSS